MTTRVLETDRLVVRPFTLADAPFILELLNEPGWLRYIGDRGVRTIEDAQTYLLKGPIAMNARLGYGLWAVETRADGTILGMCGLLKRDFLADVDLGYAFLNRYCGRGFATEAANATLAHGYRALGFRQIVALTDPENQNSMRLLQRLGFAFDRVLQLPGQKGGSRLFVHRPGAARAEVAVRAG